MNIRPRFRYFDAVAALMVEAATTITEPWRKNFAKERVDIKPDGTPFTQADGDTEAFLTRGLTELLPGSKVFGEESSAGGDWRASPLAGDMGDIWTLDPVDGTKSIVTGGPYGIMVALRKNKSTRAAWIHYPVTNDFLFASEEDEGAFHITGSQPGDMVVEKIAVPRMRVGDIELTFYAPGIDINAAFGFADIFEKQRPCICIANDVRQMLLEGNAAIFNTYITPWDYAPTTYITAKCGAPQPVDSEGARFDLDSTNCILAPDAGVMTAILKKTRNRPLHHTP